MSCMLLFTFTVVSKKFDSSIPCPLNASTTYLDVMKNQSLDSEHVVEEEEEQYCEPKLTNINARVSDEITCRVYYCSIVALAAMLQSPVM